MGEGGRAYVRSPNHEKFGQINPVFMRVCGSDKTDLTTNRQQLLLHSRRIITDDKLFGKNPAM